MTFSVCFIERRDADTQSLEKVFRLVAREVEKMGIQTQFQKVPGGNGFFGIVRNLFSFRPPPSDIYHVTGHIHYLGLVLDRSKTVLTIHDLWILHNRRGLRRWILKKLLFDWPLRRLRWVTAISEATRRELATYTVADPDSIEVIPDPVDLEVLSNGTSFDFERPTILHVGTAPQKNLTNVIEAVRTLSCRLRVVGSLSNEQRSKLEESGIDFTNDPQLDDAEMLNAYQSADLLIFCSKFEGFGLPIVEAQAIGLPVVTSDREPMRTVGGESAKLADPDDPASIRAAVNEVITNAEERERMIRDGKKNVLRYAPELVADQYVRLYKRMLSAK